MISFNVPPYVGTELNYVRQAVEAHKICGDGQFTKQCNAWMEQRFGARKVLLTTSGSTALDMAALLCGLQPGDEVIITNLWETLQYRVAEIQIIQPNEVEQILIKPGQELVTLLTCHPYASGGRQRYLVICERVNENN